MNLEEKYLLINFDTDNLAEQMISDEKYIDSLLQDEDLSIISLEGSLATIHNVDKKLYIYLDKNSKIYKPTLLEYIEQPLFIKFATSFDSPKKIKLLNVSPQIGGVIDTNYGIKFQIELTDKKADAIYESKIPNKPKKEYRKQADKYIRRKFRYSLNDDNYDNDINSFLTMMKNFYNDGLGQIKDHKNIKDDFNIFYTKDTAFHFAEYQGEYYGLTEINSVFFIYKVLNEEVYIIGDIRNIDYAQDTILKYKTTFS